MLLKKFSCILLSGCILLFAASSDIQLSGIVKDNADNAIEGADVYLKSDPQTKVQSQPSGAFAIEVVSAATPYNISVSKPMDITGHGASLNFNVAFPVAEGMISIFSGNGRRIKDIELNNIGAGKQTVSLADISNGFYIIQITLDNQVTRRKLIAAGSDMIIAEIGSGTTARNSITALMKQDAEYVDTLVAEKEGFVTTEYPLTSLMEDGILLIMDEAGGPVDCTPASVADLPEPAALPENKKLPSPFKFFDGHEMTKKAEWPCRRQEILNMAYKYMYGQMPPFAAPEVEVTGTVSGNGVTANIAYNGKTASLNFGTSGNGDVLLISMGSGIAPPQTHRTYSVSNSVIDGWKNNCKSLFNMNPCGEIALGWGCNILCRAIASDPDGGIDTNKIMTTGCSNTAKAAFLAAAFCEGIDLTVVVESGGFGDASFRVAEYLYHDGNGWKCSDPPQGVWSPDHGSQWLAEPYMDENVSKWVVNNPGQIYKLPYDQHSLVACIAPRAACLLTNQNGQAGSGEWCHLNGTGSAISYWAAEPVWNALGVPENFGGRMYTESSTPMHCSNPASAKELANEFFKRVFEGDENAETDVLDAHDEDLQQPKSEWEATWAEGDMLTKTLQ